MHIKRFKSNADIDTLIDSIMLKNISNIKKILNSGIDVNSYKKRTFTALDMATSCDNKKIIELLLEYGELMKYTNYLNEDFLTEIDRLIYE